MQVLRACAFVFMVSHCAPVPSATGPAPVAEGPGEVVVLDVNGWRAVEGDANDLRYYAVVNDANASFLRARYRQSTEPVSLAYAFDDTERARARLLRWRWRALKLPEAGRECKRGSGDSAASVYVTWKRGMRWYSLKYTWSSALPEGTTCRDKRSLFVAQDTVVLASGGPLNAWRHEQLDLNHEFRKHFEDSAPDARVPELAGIGILTDGDQTGSDSEADYGGFVLVP